MHELINKLAQIPWVLPLVISCLAGVIAAQGASSIPLEDHDVLVAQTAQNMLDSGNWIVPEFNDEYRLQKPPLSYWAVGLTARLFGASKVSPLIARAPSIAAAIGMSLLAFWLALLLFDRRTAILACLFSIASLGFFTWSHSARPDMLYAFWCTLLFASWVAANFQPDRQSLHWMILLWVSAGLATLTKGPQAPAIMLVGFVLHAWLSGHGVVIVVKRLRPITGAIILALILLPWWLLLRQAIGADELAESQLSGSLLAPSAGSHFGPYYFLRSPLFWLPWSILLPFAVKLGWRDWRKGPGLLAVGVVFAMVIFTFGPQYREHYLLPWQIPACVLLAAGVLAYPVSRLWLWAPWVVALLGGMWLIFEGNETALLIVMISMVALGLAADKLIHNELHMGACFIAIGVAMALLQAALTPAIWSKNRYRQAGLATEMRQHITQPTVAATINIGSSTFVYYLDRRIAEFEGIQAFCRWLPGQIQQVLVFYPDSLSPALRQKVGLKFEANMQNNNVASGIIPAGTQCH